MATSIGVIVAEAQQMAMDAVAAKLDITEMVVDRSDPILVNTRIKLERIQETR